MLVRQLTGRLAGQVIDMPFAEAQACLANGSVAPPEEQPRVRGLAIPDDDPYLRTNAAPDSTGEPEPADEDRRDETLLGSSVLPAVVDIGDGKSTTLGEIVVAAYEASGLTAEAWNTLPEEQRESLLITAVEELKAKAGADEDDAADEAPVAPADTTTAPAIDIPEDWKTRHHTERKNLAKSITGESYAKADDADAAIAAYLGARGQ